MVARTTRADPQRGNTMTHVDPIQKETDDTAQSETDDTELAEDLVEEISIDGMCGVY
jgi:mycofactocin precursor